MAEAPDMHGAIILGPQTADTDPEKRFMLCKDGITREVPVTDLWSYLGDAMTAQVSDEVQNG